MMNMVNDRDLEKFKRHVLRPKRYVLKDDQGNSDEFEFQAVGTKYLPDFMKLHNLSKLSKEEQNIKDKAVHDVKSGAITAEKFEEINTELELASSMRMMEGEGPAILLDLIHAMVMKSYPDIPDDVIWGFIDRNFQALQVALMETNESMFTKDSDTISKVQELKNRMKNATK